MTIRNVPPYPTIEAAIAACVPGDTIVIAAGYSGSKTAKVTVDNLTFSAPASVTGIVLTAGNNIRQITLAGDSPIDIIGKSSDATYVGNDGANVISGISSSSYSGGGGNDTFVFRDASGGSGSVLDGGAGLDTVRLGQNGSLNNTTLNSVEVLDVSSVWATISQLSTFASITDSSGSANSRIVLLLRGPGGTLDLSSRVVRAHSVTVGGGSISSGGLRITGTVNDDEIGGTEGNDVLDGGAGNDLLKSSSGFDTLKGGDGNDRFEVSGQSGIVDGGAGIDTVGGFSLGGYTFHNVEILDTSQTTATTAQLASFSTITNSSQGPAGYIYLWLTGAGGAIDLSGRITGPHDTLIQDNGLTAGVSVTGSANFDNINGSAFDDMLNGGGGDDRLYGAAGNDRLDGGAGADQMLGGAGNDAYYVDSASDTIREDDDWEPGVDDGGTDLVSSTISYTLVNFIENLALVGTGAIDATGNALANLLTGNAGNNKLDGKSGVDTMKGGAGDDTYYVDNASDKVIEADGQGTDLVYSSVDFSLAGQYIESLTLTGSALKATGNSLANVLTGNAGSNLLDGKAGADKMVGSAGNDTYYVDNASDKVIEADGQGTDLVYSSLDFSLAGQYIENLTLMGSALGATGNSLANILTGNAGNNVLDGKAGADKMVGSAGDDTYYVDNAGDRVIEADDQGADLAYSSVDFSLAGQYIERLSLTGSALKATGNTLANTLAGNSRNNVLDGNTGADVMTGGGGSDAFVFSTSLVAGNVDTITDFNVAADTIRLSHTIFKAIVGTGTLSVAQFVANSSGTAQDAADRIVYETDTGKLFYDSNGSAAGGSVQFATLSPGLGLTNADFLIV